MYCGLSIVSEVFLIFTTQLYQYFSVFSLFPLLSDESEVFLPNAPKQQYFMLLTSGGGGGCKTTELSEPMDAPGKWM